jgi:biotin transport system permease protein
MLTLTSPVETWAHRVRPGVKLALLAVWTLGIFWLQSPLTMAMAFAAVLGLVATGGGTFLAASIASLRPLWPFFVLVGLWHLWIDDAPGGVVILLRLVAAVMAANFVTMTTRLSDMIAVIERLARPLARLGLSPKVLALSMALVIRFVPVMGERLDQITEAWCARARRKPRWRVLVPATLAALDDADHVAEALRARGGVE